MITGEIRSKDDRIWDTLPSGGISNPLVALQGNLIVDSTTLAQQAYIPQPRATPWVRRAPSRDGNANRQAACRVAILGGEVSRATVSRTVGARDSGEHGPRALPWAEE